MLFFLFSLIVLMTDQFTKYIVIKNMPLHHSVPVINKVFYITRVHNPGAAFGLFADMTGFFIVATLLSLALILYYRQQVPKKHISQHIALVLLFGGASGNLIDRLRFGYVVDFFDFRIWPVFNIADAAIVTGAFLLTMGLARTIILAEE